MALARRYKGVAILWEHRYYGKSVPFLNKFSNVVRPPSLPTGNYLISTQDPIRCE
jgi:hypothetical protein